MKTTNIPISFESNFEEKHITAIFDFDGTKIGFRFESAGQVFEMFARLLKNASEVWPDDPMIISYFGESEE